MATDNPQLRLAEEFVQHMDCNIYLTGKAGTGKTTFLHAIREQTRKRLIVTAPTGVAAINAGGVTLHSFFQLAPGPFFPDAGQQGENRFRMSREKKNIIRNLDLLVIDEVSMVRADLLDAVDHALRQYRRSSRPFGGVQLLLIGDLHQLPPVVKEQEWQLLQNSYDSPYFFSSRALAQTELVTIELLHIYRQSDSEFIDILNKVRDNRLDDAAVRKLNSRHLPDQETAEDAITLCTHNSRADAINRKKLDELRTNAHFFQAELDGDFPEHAFPVAAELELKPGAQVMFLRNDPGPAKEYFNGKIGHIDSIDTDRILVSCPDDADPIAVARSTWDNIKYTIDPDTSEISQEVIGTFAQYPLKPAWAITIHKSQGLTFDHAVIDAQAAFAPGQVYVALSRCRSLDGVVLRSPLASGMLQADPRLIQFVQHAASHPPSPSQLAAAKVRYQQKLLLEAFSFDRLRAAMGNLVSVLNANPTTVHVTGGIDINIVLRATVEEIYTVGENFKRQLQGMFREDQLPGADPAILERLAKAAVYFKEKFTAQPVRMLTTLITETDNKELRKRIKNGRKWLEEETAAKLAGIMSCAGGFSPPDYLRAVSNAMLDTPLPAPKKAPAPTYKESDIDQPALFTLLKEWRTEKAKEERLAAFHIMHQKTLIQLAIRMPDSMKTFMEVKGIGKKLAERYGEELIQIIDDYRRQHNITEISLPENDVTETEAGEEPETPLVPKGQTRICTLEMFRAGHSITAIAEKRGLALTTIEGHMAYWVENGTVAIDQLVSPERVEAISARLLAMPQATFKEIKESLDDDCSYGQIKLVHAHLGAGRSD